MRPSASGVNDSAYDPAKHFVVSNASCTTNCLAPMAKVLNDTFGIEAGFMSTIHSYTNDQRILDLPHEDLRRARAAAVNIIPSSTGRGQGHRRGHPRVERQAERRRVPRADALRLGDGFYRDAQEKRDGGKRQRRVQGGRRGRQHFKGMLEYSDEPLVLQDIVDNPHSCIFDSALTLTLGEKFVKVVGWYDNEWGYSNRCVAMLELLAQ